MADSDSGAYDCPRPDCSEAFDSVDAWEGHVYEHHAADDGGA